MSITNIADLTARLRKPRLLVLDDETSVYVRQLPVAEAEELQRDFAAMAKLAEPTVPQSEDEEAQVNKKIIEKQVSVLAKLLTDESGNQLITEDSELEALGASITMDFLALFFSKYQASFTFGEKELSAAADQFRQ